MSEPPRSFDRFSPAVRDSLAIAQSEAIGMNSLEINSGHLLIALIRTDRSIARLFSAKASHPEDDLRARLITTMGIQKSVPPVDLTLTPRVKDALTMAVGLADDASRKEVTAIDLFAALVTSDDSLAIGLILAAGLDPTLLATSVGNAARAGIWQRFWDRQ